MKDRLCFRAIGILIAAALVAAVVVLMPRTSEVYAAESVFSDEEAAEDLVVPEGYDGQGLELNGWPDSDDGGGEPLTKTNDDEEIKVKFNFKNKSATVARLKVIDNQHGGTITYTKSCAVGKGDTLTDTFYPYNNEYCFIVQIWAFGWHDAATMDKICFGDPTEYTITAKGTALKVSMDWSPKPWYWEGKDSAENGSKLVIDYSNKGAYVGRMKITDMETGVEYTSGACAVGESDTLSVDAVAGRKYRMALEVWYFKWIWARRVSFTAPDSGTLKIKVTSTGYSWNPKWEYGAESSSGSGTDDVLAPATTKASKKTVKKGKKTTVKVTSNSGAKLTVKASNKKSKTAKKKKYVKIKNGKTAKITFTKKAPKGKYTFKVTSPAKGSYKKTVKTITIKVK